MGRAILVLLACVLLPAHSGPGIPEPLHALLEPHERAALQPQVDFQQLLERTLVPAWGRYGGAQDYDEGYRAGASHLLRNLEWSELREDSLRGLLKGKSWAFKRGALGA